MTLIKKRWKTIFYQGVDYSFLYKVSNHGEIYSIRKGKLLKPTPNKKGYLSVCLSKKGKVKRVFVHRLVATMFIRPLHKGEVVDHQLGVEDNKSSSLKIVTHRKNNSKERTIKSGLPVGVSRQGKRFRAKIKTKMNENKAVNLGFYDCQYTASVAYQLALFLIQKYEYTDNEELKDLVNIHRDGLGLNLIN